ncbi:MAG: hypothetical protein AB1453_02100 [Chloroflexota bacterium]|jgi:uncharacterized membrane protein YphA (DoxX/SURF4 family)
MTTFNLVLQSLHNVTRWVLIILAIIVIVRGFTGWLRGRRFNNDDNRYGMLYTLFFDIQLLGGLVLYFTKGWAVVLTADFAAAMRSSGTRFFAIEHLLLMLIALVVVHVTRSQSRKAGSDLLKHRRAAIGFLISFVLMLAAIPWPFLSYGRPLLRLLGFQF